MAWPEPARGTARPRFMLETDGGAEEEATVDPIAAALRAKLQRQEAVIKKAAEAAARAASANVKTMFFDPPSSSSATETNSSLAPSSLPTATAKEPNSESFNPLASLLGSYARPESSTDDESNREEEGSAAEVPHAVSVNQQQDGAAAQPQGSLPQPFPPEAAPTPQPGGDMDAELASFMQDLESSGLLGQDGQPSGTAEGPEQAPPDSTAADGVPAEAPAASSAAEPAEPPAVDSRQAEEAASMETAAAEAGEGASQQAEQRVLGPLGQVADWLEVMDMASRRVYFWNTVTNEVLWHPPAGAAPRTTAEADAAADLAAGGSGPAPRIADGAEAADSGAASRPTDQTAAAPEGVTAATEVAACSPEADQLLVPSAEEEGAMMLPHGQVVDVALQCEALERQAADIAARTWDAAGQLLEELPRLVRLAVEAGVRWHDWQSLTALQRRLQPGRAGTAAELPWSICQDHFRARLQGMEEELAAAAAEAAAAQEAPPMPPPELPPMPAEVEEGELPAQQVRDVDMEVDMDMELEPATGSTSPAPLPSAPADEPPGPALPASAAAVPQTLQAVPHLPDEVPRAALPAGAINGAAMLSKQPATVTPAAMHAPTLPAAVAVSAAAAASTPQAPRRKEYHAEPIKVDADPPPLPMDAHFTAAGEHRDSDGRKRKAEKVPVGPGVLGTKKKKAGKVSNLINKWQAVRKDLDEEEEAAEKEALPDPETLERKRRQQAEEWRLQQLHSGKAAEENANFQPLAGDWRARVKAAKKQERRAAKAAQAEPAPAASGAPDLAALSRGLPAGWRAMWDKASADVYYGNLATKMRSLSKWSS